MAYIDYTRKDLQSAIQATKLEQWMTVLEILESIENAIDRILKGR